MQAGLLESATSRTLMDYTTVTVCSNAKCNRMAMVMAVSYFIAMNLVRMLDLNVELVLNMQM